MDDYIAINKKLFDKWVKAGWEWGIPISAETFKKAQAGDWALYLTPTKSVPHDWFPPLHGKHVLGLASGGGQQIPLLAAQGAIVTCLDFAKAQLATEKMVSKREGYDVTLVEADMSKPLPFPDHTFDLIIFPVANVYVRDVAPIFKECYRILKRGGLLLSGLDNGLNFAFSDEDGRVMFPLPFNPLTDQEQYDYMVKHDYGIQFSHSISSQIESQLAAGFTLLAIYEDTNLSGVLAENNIPTFFATKVRKD